ncbi:STE like transcription factor-domain-containing protein [Pilobolus umbonatus]|nr:STE like transcription factor-domain-containing protein [Pilobolus umbonatus]
MHRSTMSKPHSYNKKQLDNKSSSTIASYGLPMPTDSNTKNRLQLIDDLKFFFATATQQWDPNKSLKRFELTAGESVSCVLWNNLFFITGTDIVRSLTFRFHAFGRPVVNAKKFEEGIFSDLRNLKPGHDARLEDPKSELLDMLYKNNCIRTQKKQKVFFWFSVPHDRLFLDALERDLKREKMGMEPTTKAVAEPAISLSLDSTQELFDQLRKNMSQSAAATAQAFDDLRGGPMPNTSLSLSSIQPVHSIEGDDDENGCWSTHPVSHTPWSSSQSRLEQAAAQAKRSRVNSVPANLGQQQHFQMMAQRHNRLSQSSYFSGNVLPHSRTHRTSTSSASSLISTAEDALFDDNHSLALSDISKSTNLSSPISKTFSHDYMDPISHGVDQLDISSNKKIHNVLPSKSLDSNAIKKTKTIFGTLSLFDGSPSYKQRRRRAASVSTSALIPSSKSNPLHIGGSGGPDRVRRHDKCHSRTPSTTNLSHVSSFGPFNSNSSRLAMAAVKAGFVPNQIMNNAPFPGNNQMHMSPISASTSTGWLQPQSQSMDYLCPLMSCRHLFKRPEHLERHMHTAHMFVCKVCGKQFPHSETLAQHKQEHALQMDHPTLTVDRENDDDSSPEDHFNSSKGYNKSFMEKNQSGNNVFGHGQDGGFYSSNQSFGNSHSSGWSIGISGSTSSNLCNSRSSTLSPMVDLDFEIPESTPLTMDKPNGPSSIEASTSTTSVKTVVIKGEPVMSIQDVMANNDWKQNDSYRMNALNKKNPSTSIYPHEDDFSSSSASSPCSTTQYKTEYINRTSYSLTFPTLLAPFKPEIFQQDYIPNDMYFQPSLFQQPSSVQPSIGNDLQHDIGNSSLFNQSGIHLEDTMDTSSYSLVNDNDYPSVYPSYIDQFTPFLISSDYKYM